MSRYTQVKKSRAYKNDTNCCAVVALSIAGRIPYPKAYKILEQVGRRHDKSPTWPQFYKALELAGCEKVPITNRGGKPLRQKNGNRYTTKTIGQRLKSGYYVVETREHVAAVVNGTVEDWSSDRNKVVTAAYRIIVPRGSRS